MVTSAVDVERDDHVLAAAWFVRLWAVGIVAHIVGNPRFGQLWPEPTAVGILTVLLGLAAIVLIARPGDLSLVATAASTVAVAVAELPLVDDHWLLAAFVSVALLISLWKRDSWGWFSTTARWMLLAFSAWTGFHLLTPDFFEPAVSCAAEGVNSWLSSYGLPPLAEGIAGTLAAVASAALLLGLPVLLLWTATRRVGVLLGMAFYFVASLHLGQPHYDIAAILLPLLTLFLGDRVMAALEERRPHPGWAGYVIPGLLGLFVLVSLMPASDVTYALLRYGAFVLWAPFGAWLIWTTARVSHGRPEVRLRTEGVIMPLLVVVVVANGALPYLEVKTGSSWNIYANLVTAGGESNHLIIRRTLPLTDEQMDPVVILDTDDPGLQTYVDSGYALTWSRFRDYLAGRPEAEVTYERQGFVRTVTGAEVGEALPWWRDRFQLFRAIDLERPVRCQAYRLPAK